MKKIIFAKLISSFLSVFIVVSSLGCLVSADESISVSGDSVGTVQDIIDSAGSNEDESDQDIEDSLPVVLDESSDDTEETNIADDESRDYLHQGILHFEDEEEEVESTDGMDTDIANAEATDPQDEEILPVVVCGETHISAKDSPLLNPSLALSSNTSGYSKYTFTETDQALYNNLKSQISDVAYGRKASSDLFVSFDDLGIGDGLTKAELGLNDEIYQVGSGYNSGIKSALSNIMPHTKEILYTLLVECPFELYWYDKTQGLSVSGYSYTARKVNGEYVLFLEGDYYSDGLLYSFVVANDYASTDSYTVNSSKVSAAKQAENNAKAIVNKYASLSDMEKLTKYKEEICSLVSYNSSAAGGGARYGDPWQMVYVFDRNSSTNVVCEGYAKAFKYLCDHTDFTSDEINCIIAYGDFQGTSGSGGHMWNVVSLGNGTNYLVDLTNCDTGTIGYSDLLFMRNATTVNSINSYSFNCNGSNITYIYDSEMRSILFRDSAIKITTTALVKAPTLSMRRIDSGIQLNWNSVSGASKYKLYRRTETTDWKAIKETTSLTFTDPISSSDSTNYTYCVRGVTNTGNYLNALEDSASTKDILPIPITSQPSDCYGFIGNTAKFKVVATGSGLKYQWQTFKSGTWVNSSLPGYNTATLSVDVTKARDGYQFRCVITNTDNESVFSDSAVLHVNEPVSITTQPQDYSGTVGSTAIFKVVAKGTGLKYQWQTYRSGTWVNSSISGSTTDTLTVGVTDSRDGYKFRCVVTDGGNKTATTIAVTLRVTVPLIISTQPKDYTGEVGSTASFKIAAQGKGIKFQWQTYSSGKWVNSSLQGSNTATLSVPVIKSRDGYKFRCVVTDSTNTSIYSNAATLHVTVPAALSITSQPKSYSGRVGSMATFTVVAQGTGLKYQWQTYKDGAWVNSSLPGSNTDTLSVSVTRARHGYNFRCVVTDSNNKKVISNKVVLKVTS